MTRRQFSISVHSTLAKRRRKREICNYWSRPNQSKRNQSSYNCTTGRNYLSYKAGRAPPVESQHHHTQWSKQQAQMTEPSESQFCVDRFAYQCVCLYVSHLRPSKTDLSQDAAGIVLIRSQLNRIVCQDCYFTLPF